MYSSLEIDRKLKFYYSIVTQIHKIYSFLPALISVIIRKLILFSSRREIRKSSRTCNKNYNYDVQYAKNRARMFEQIIIYGEIFNFSAVNLQFTMKRNYCQAHLSRGVELI